MPRNNKATKEGGSGDQKPGRGNSNKRRKKNEKPQQGSLALNAAPVTFNFVRIPNAASDLPPHLQRNPLVEKAVQPYAPLTIDALEGISEYLRPNPLVTKLMPTDQSKLLLIQKSAAAKKSIPQQKKEDGGTDLPANRAEKFGKAPEEEHYTRGISGEQQPLSKATANIQHNDRIVRTYNDPKQKYRIHKDDFNRAIGEMTLPKIKTSMKKMFKTHRVLGIFPCGKEVDKAHLPESKHVKKVAQQLTAADEVYEWAQAQNERTRNSILNQVPEDISAKQQAAVKTALETVSPDDVAKDEVAVAKMIVNVHKESFLHDGNPEFDIHSKNNTARGLNYRGDDNPIFGSNLQTVLAEIDFAPQDKITFDDTQDRRLYQTTVTVADGKKVDTSQIAKPKDMLYVAAGERAFDALKEEMLQIRIERETAEEKELARMQEEMEKRWTLEWKQADPEIRGGTEEELAKFKQLRESDPGVIHMEGYPRMKVVKADFKNS